jgi:hypothetical protein
MIASLIASVVMGFMLYRSYKANPEAFSAQNFSKSFFSMGILALVLIAAVGFAVMMLRR